MLRAMRLLVGPLAISAALACGVSDPEAERAVLYVGPERVGCTGVGPRTCLLVKEDPEAEWRAFYAPIKGFDYEPGFFYKLLVSKRPIDNPPADGLGVAWRLTEVLEKIRR